MASQGAVRRQSTSYGRSGPRSKTGCQTCRQRRVRCDEKRPVCSHCIRLKRECVYQLPQQRRRWRRSRPSQADECSEPDIADQAGGDPSLVNPGVDSGIDASNIGLGTPFPTIANPERPDSVETRDHVYSQMTTPPTSTNLSQSSFQSTSALYSDSALTPLGSNDALDSVSRIISSSSMFNNNNNNNNLASGDLDDITTTWDSVELNDYFPLHGSTFSFTSLGFSSSLGLLDTNQLPGAQASLPIEATQNWRNSLAEVTTSEPPHEHTPIIGQGSRPITDRTLTADPSSQEKSTAGPVFAVAPPILSKDQQEVLFMFFKKTIRPPASIVGVDPLGWHKIKRHVLLMAGNERDVVSHALLALSAWVFDSTIPGRLGLNRDEFKLLASRLHDAACAAVGVTLSHEGWETRNEQELLVCVFLLAWFEVASDENESHPSFPTHLAEQIIVQGKHDKPSSAQLFQWLDSFDAKMSHLGGSRLLSEPTLEVVRRLRVSLADVEGLNDENEYHGLKNTEANAQSKVTLPRGAMQTATTAKNRLAFLLSSSSAPMPSKNTIKMDLFNILLHPAFEFHLASQAFSRRIGSNDRHHLSRGTPEIEFMVMENCMRIEEELQELWKRRPSIINLNAQQMKEFVSQDIAQQLERLFSIYIATYWAQFIYIHRVAFWTLKHTQIVQKAIDQTGDMMRRSVGESTQEDSLDYIARPRTRTLHPGLMWVCFLFGCEVTDPVQQQWAIYQLKALGELSSLQEHETGDDGNDEPFTLHLDQKGAQTALKVSRLLEVLVERQTKLGARVDGKYLSQEIFGCHFYII